MAALCACAYGAGLRAESNAGGRNDPAEGLAPLPLTDIIPTPGQSTQAAFRVADGTAAKDLSAWGNMIGVRLTIGFLAVCASAVLTVFSAFGTHVAGYVAATLIAFTMAATARRASLTSATESGKPETPGVALTVRIVVVTGFALGVVHAWYIARALS